MRKVLILAHVASMVGLFNIPNIELLQEMGYEVHVACNFNKGNVFNNEQSKQLKKRLTTMNVKYFQIDFDRNIFRIDKNLQALRDVIKLIQEQRYLFIHCHTPIGGFVGRIASKITHTKVIYTCHGFHFYKGAPLKNWLVYYPIEKICSYMTDTLLCINKEDYRLAKTKMKAKKIAYIPGVGINSRLERISNDKRQYLRESIGVKETDILLLSVGELNKNKNHTVVLEALNVLKNPRVHYAIAGKGELKKSLEEQAKKNGILENVHFLGFQDKIGDWYDAADIFVFPSYREGLSVSLMEAMSHKLPCVVSDIRGNNDLIENNTWRFNPSNIKQLSGILQKMICEKSLIEINGKINQKVVEKYSLENVMKITRKIYESM